MELSDLKVLYEDNHLIAVNKPCNVLVHEDETGDTVLAEVVKLYLKVRYEKPGNVFLGVVHRLDRPVSGVIVFARTSKALERMNKKFQERAITKIYWALVVQLPQELSGTLVHYLVKDPEANRVRVHQSASKAGKDGKRAELHYRLIGSIANHHLLEVEPFTGRPHQIRAQLAKIGCPIRGDKKYGAPVWNLDRFIHLHSRLISFEHPVTNERVTIKAPVPKEQLWDEFRHFENISTEF